MSYIVPPSTLPPGSIVDSYRRDSGGARQDKSTDQQLIEIESYCATYQLVLRHKFVDVAKSGGSTVGRDDFNRMMKLYEDQLERPRGLILWNHARFARDIDDAQFNKILLRQWGMIIHSLNDQIPEGDHGRIIEFLIDVANEEKRKQTSADAKRGLMDLVRRYRCVPGTPPRGFKRTPVNLGPRRDKSEHIAHSWDPDPDHIPRIQKAFAMKAAGLPVKEIAKATKLFASQNSYTTFFKNKLYIGTLEYGGEVFENYCKPMIDIETWLMVQKILALHTDRQNATATNSMHPRRKAHSENYLLSGIIYCARCGAPLWSMTSGQRDGSYYFRYACTKAKNKSECDFKPIPAKPLETEIINQLNRFFENPANLHGLMNADHQHNLSMANQAEGIIEDLQKQLAAARRSITNMNNAIAERGHSGSMLDTLAKFEEDETLIKSQIEVVKTENKTPQEPLSFSEIAILSEHIVADLNSKDKAKIRNILLATVQRIIADRNDTQVFGHLQIHTPREVKTLPEDENPAIITALSLLQTVGAPSYTRSIEFSFKLNPRSIHYSKTRKKKPRS